MSKRNLFTIVGLAVVWFNTALTILIFSTVFDRGAYFANVSPVAAAIAATVVVLAERFKLVPRDDERESREAEQLETRIRRVVAQMQREGRTSQTTPINAEDVVERLSDPNTEKRKR